MTLFLRLLRTRFVFMYIIYRSEDFGKPSRLDASVALQIWNSVCHIFNCVRFLTRYQLPEEREWFRTPIQFSSRYRDELRRTGRPSRSSSSVPIIWKLNSKSGSWKRGNINVGDRSIASRRNGLPFIRMNEKESPAFGSTLSDRSNDCKFRKVING